MRHGLRLAVLAGVGLLTAGFGWADKPADPPAKDEPKLPTRKELMAAKLKHTQTVLEGIAVNDFARIITAADELVRVSRANDFLNAYKGEDYMFQVKQFRQAAEAVGVKAERKNMDGVMVAYNELTGTCLKCHQAMRDKKFDARLTPLAPPARGE
jgi:hypothetical protein